MIAMSDLGGLSGPSEPVPNQLRILAAQENLGNLVSIHRPSTRPARIVFRDARVYLYDKGVVVSNGRGSLSLFDWERTGVQRKGGGWQLTRSDGARFRLTRHWTGYAELGQALANR